MTRLSHFLSLAALAAATSAQAAELPAEIKQAGTLKLTVNSTYAPMEYRDPASNELVGLDIDLANELAKRLGFAGYTLREVAVNSHLGGPIQPRVMAMEMAKAASADAPVPIEAGKTSVVVNVSGSVQLK